ncbi:hypothetical protein HYE59_05520 [Aggregatibacter actinomycetemcomitans]|uniref:hypothetical protein n=1 Tax=Aggregatibacter actinomycetemcomitans TaxID=714 RepID=UPI00197BC017|nr:hypothetical protein [Aggregatibacter actinomycetemcomitans]MBN6077007.1 hypothetical protein [Aggregatibacter actinomycetemcomitans]
MSNFLKLDFVAENFYRIKKDENSKLEYVTDGYEYVEAFINTNLITYFVECEDIPANGTTPDDDDFNELLEVGSLLFLTKEGIEVVDDICRRFLERGKTSDVATSKGANFVMVANNVDDIMNQLRFIKEGSNDGNQ